MLFGPIAVLGSVLPPVGDLLRFGAALFAGTVAFALSLITIAVGWVAYRPLVGVPLVIALVRLPGGGDFDIGRVAQNMMEAAGALGIGSCPVTLHREACARERLHVPDDHGCRYALAFGYPDLEAERLLIAADRERDAVLTLLLVDPARIEHVVDHVHQHRS